MADQAANDGKQNPLVHEAGDTDEVDTNERGDDKVKVEQPSGEEAPRSEQR